MTVVDIKFVRTRPKIRVTYGTQQHTPHRTPKSVSDAQPDPLPNDDTLGSKKASQKRLDLLSDSDTDENSSTRKSKKRKRTQATLFDLIPGGAHNGALRHAFQHDNTAKHKDRRKCSAKLEQTFLDFGQRLNTPKPCRLCGMTYQKGREEDESLHNRFHRNWERRQAKALEWRFPLAEKTDSGNSIRVVYPKALAKGLEDYPVKGNCMATIIAVDAQSPRRQVMRAVEILNVANRALGAFLISPKDLELLQRKIVLYVSPGSQVEGCVLAERIETANRAIEGSVVRASKEEVSAVCGISRVWVAGHTRRNGIASQMIDAVSKLFVYGCRIELQSIAFSQPTEGGRALAKHVFGRNDFLIYTER